MFRTADGSVDILTDALSQSILTFKYMMISTDDAHQCHR